MGNGFFSSKLFDTNFYFHFHFQMEKRRSSFPFVFRRSRPNSPDSFTGKRTLDIIQQTSNKSDHTSSPSRTRNRKSKTSNNSNKNHNNNNTISKSLVTPGTTLEQDKGNNTTKSSGLFKPQKVKKNDAVCSALLNVIPVISLTSADNETIDDLDAEEPPVDPNEVITILPA